MGKRFFEVSALIVLILFFIVCSVFAFPNFINYQGQLTDSSGNLLHGDYALTFMIYDTETEGEALWTEQHTITVTNGLYNAELGTVNTFPEDLFETEMLYLEVIIHNEDTGSDETLLPRIPFTSTGFAMKAKDTETVAWSNITGKPATFADDVMYVDSNGNVGIGTSTPNATFQIIGSISRQGTTLNGTNTDTHVNLGVNSFTDNQYSTVSGGYNNTAGGRGSTVSGGESNTASGYDATVSGGGSNIAGNWGSTVSGGGSNTASGWGSTVSGGANNVASGTWSTVSGGLLNTADGHCSTASGGGNNTAAGDYSWAGGHNMQLTEDADRTFAWGYSDSNVSISTPDSFIIYSGNIGIGTKEPAAKLEVDGDVYFEGGDGDVNLNGEVTGGDTLIIARYLNRLSTLNREEFAHADVDGDGRVTWEDAAITGGLIFEQSKDTLKRSMHSVYGATNSDTFYVNGKVGIGTMYPGAKLEVHDESTGIWPYAGSALKVSDGNGNVAYLGADDQTPWVGSYSNTSFRIAANQLTHVTIQPNGNVGIGTTIPTEKLEVAGAVKATAFIGDGSYLTGISSESFARSTSKTVTASYSPEFGDPGLIADGIFAPESTGWSDANYAVGLNSAGYDTNLKIDLGAIYDIYRLRVQADCNDDYRVEYSMDDSTWNILYDLPRAAHPGLKTRDSGTFESVKARYLRIYVVSGDDAYSVSEVEVYAYGINIADSGNVGIGTTNPEKPLVVTGSEERGIAKLSFSNNDRYLSLGGDWPYIDSYGSGARLLLNFNSDQDIDIGNGDLYIVNSNGNVGIGKTEPRNKLDIGSAFSFHDLGHKVIGIGYVPGNDTSLVNGYSAAIRLDPVNGGLQIQTNSRFGTVGNWVGASATRMMVDRNGNVGIGTMTPGAKLDVAGDLIIGGTFNINGQLFKNAGSFSLGNGISKYEWKNNTIDTTLMVLDNTGNLGIGSTNPGAKLTISNSISNDYGKSSVFVSSHNSYFDFYGGLVFRGTGQLWSARFTGTDSMSSDGEILGIYREEIGEGTLGESIAVFKNNGNVGIGTTSPAHRLHVIGDIAYTGSLYDVSDIMLKENITYIENAVEKVSSINGIYFNNKGESQEKREVGVIAQEVEEVLPEVVSEDNDGYKSVDYSKLTPLLIEAIKELKSENEELKERILALEAELQP